jgi:hypothetical protein
VIRRIWMGALAGAALTAAATIAAQSLGEVAARNAAQAASSDVQRLLEITGSLKLGRQMASMTAQQVMNAVVGDRPDVPARVREIVTELVDAEFDRAFAPDGQLTRGLARVYAKHFTDDEIRGLIAFYETPLGRKVTETLPAIAEASMQVSVKWADTAIPGLQKRIEAQLRSEGLIK